MRKLTVSYNETFRRLMKVSRSTPANWMLAEIVADYIEVQFREAAHRLITRLMSANNKFLLEICINDALAVW